MVPLLTLGRAGFIGRIAVLATGGLLTLGTPAPKTLCSQMTTPDYDAWDALVRAHVRPSQLRGIGVNVVDYQAIRAEPGFAAFVKSLETAATSGIGKEAEYALWINSYNALAIKMVSDNPTKKICFGLKTVKIASIKDVGTVVSPVWKKPAGTVGGEVLSLDDIENTKLRAPTGYPADPLLHACIVCASVSCPDVAMTAYRPETLQADMEANMRLFLENPTKGLALNRTKGVITLSKVFQWFSDDFTKKVGKASVLDSLLPYMPDDIQKYVSEKKSTLKIEYFDYDWGVNGISPGKPGK